MRIAISLKPNFSNLVHQKRLHSSSFSGHQIVSVNSYSLLCVLLKFVVISFREVVCVCVCVYPSSSLGCRYGMNGNSGSCRQPN